jgi:hypothetical protein
MQYKVPQNIDQEDKILGPLTFTQFVYALIGGGLLLFEYSLLNTAGFLLFGIPTLLLTVCFALIKVQDQPFTRFFVSLLVFLKQPKQRIWQDQESDKPVKPLGKDFMADLNRDDPSTIKGKAKPLETAAPAPVAAPKVLAIAADQTTQSITTNAANNPAIQQASQPAPTKPPQPARRLSIKTDKGAA